MEEMKKIELNCSLCAKIGTCEHTSPCGVCGDFCPDAEAINKVVGDKTEGLTWEEAEKAAREQGKCIRRKAWPKESFAWWRKDKVITSSTNDPYIREVCRRTGFEKIPEREGFALVKYDGRCKGIPEIHWWWVPTMNTRDATDWEVFDVPNTYEDREVRCTSLEDILRHPGEYTHHKVYNLMKGIFPEKMKDPEARRNLKHNLEHDDFLREMTRVTKIMKGLDDLLK